MPVSIPEIVRRSAALETGDVTSGLLSPEQSRRFLQQVFETTPLLPLVRRELRRTRAGEIDKIGIAGRILRAKVENSDDAYRAKPAFGSVKYQTVAVRVPWEITEETLRENIEGQSLESTIAGLMTRQIAIDLEDLCLNGDAAALDTDDDASFLKINNGWIQQIRAAGHVVDHQSADMGFALFYKALRAIPNKFNNGSLRWLMSPHRQQAWEQFILSQAVANGGAVSDHRVENPCAIPVLTVPAMPDNLILLTDPRNLIVVNSYDMKIRKTTEGKEAILQDKRFYVIHFDFDAIIEEPGATAIVTNLNPLN